VWHTTPSPVPSAQGYRIVSVHSSIEATLDADSRSQRIQRVVLALGDLAARAAGPRSRWHTQVAVEQAAERAIAACHAERWVHVKVTEVEEESFSQETPGAPQRRHRYRRAARTRFELRWRVDTEPVS
jgi:hypothetical protein